MKGQKEICVKSRGNGTLKDVVFKVFLSIAIEGAKLTVSAKISLEYVTAAEAGNYRSLKPWVTVFSQTQLFLLYT